MRFSISIFAVIVVISSIARAEVRISFPTHGEFRAGQFVPVIIDVDDPSMRSSTITLHANGALPTIVKMSGQPRANAMMLMLSGETRDVWYSVDGGLETKCEIQLHDSGTESPPTDAASAIGGVDAYAPVLAWRPGASARTKRMVVLSGVLVAILLSASVMLIRHRTVSIAIAIAVVLIAIVGIDAWRRHIPAIWRAESQIVVIRSDGTTQIDSWQYLTARSTTEASIELPAGTTPVFVNARQAEALRATIVCDVSDQIAKLSCTIDPDMKLAVCNRRVMASLSSSESLPNPPSSPMLQLAQRVYLDRRTRILGERPIEWIDEQTIHWPPIVLEQSR